MESQLKQLSLEILPKKLSEYPQLLIYLASLPQSQRLSVERLLCRIDLYFLIRYALKREDIQKEWIFQRCRDIQENPNGFIDIWAREHYKALDCDTPVWTPSGWKSHGELRFGDSVYSPSGKVVKVIANTGPMLGADCYQVKDVVAAGDHIWPILIKHKKRISGTDARVVSYEKIHVSTRELHGERLCQTSPLEGSGELEIDPYVLGCWLGDGNKSGARITCAYDDLELIDHISKIYPAHETSSSNEGSGIFSFGGGIRGKKGTGLWPKFRELGVANNKHIPRKYLVSSREDRLSLLQGLMDTDGTCNTRGTATFVNTNKNLIDGVAHLARSLGIRAHARNYKTFWQVSFQAYKDLCPFRLSRKADRCKDGAPNYRKAVVSRVESRPVNCIQVMGGEYLAGLELTPTHNSTIITFGKNIQDILASHGEDPLPEWGGREVTIGIFSFNRPSAKKFLRQIKVEFENNQELKDLFPDVLYQDPKKDSSKWSEDDGLVVKRKSNPRESTVEATGLVDGQPTGMHYVIRSYDDVVTLESARSVEMIKKTTQAWGLSLSLGSDGGHSRYAGTFYADGDTYSEIIERGGATPRLFPATDNGLSSGKPVLFSKEYLDSKKFAGIYDFSCQYLCDPIPDENAYFTVNDFQWYDELPNDLRKYGASDYAVTEGDGDFTEHGVCGLAPNDHIYILDWWYAQTTADEWIDSQIDLAERHQPLRWAAEGGVIRRATEPFLNKRMRERRVFFTMKYFPSITDKPTNCRSFQARARQGMIHLPKNTSWAQDLVAQLLRFPKSKKDDKVDVCGLFGRMIDDMYGPIVPGRPSLQLVDDDYGVNEYEESDWKTG